MHLVLKCKQSGLTTYHQKNDRLLSWTWWYHGISALRQLARYYKIKGRGDSPETQLLEQQIPPLTPLPGSELDPNMSKVTGILVNWMINMMLMKHCYCLRWRCDWLGDGVVEAREVRLQSLKNNEVMLCFFVWTDVWAVWSRIIEKNKYFFKWIIY